MKVKVAGSEMHYDVRGDGPSVLLLHAFPFHLGMWDAQAEVLARTCRVIRFDVRGFGGSPPDPGPLTMERIADDAAALLDHLGVSKAVVGGLSMGGYAAFAFVRLHAARLAGLILADTRAGADSEEGRKNRAALAEKVRQQGAVAAVDAMLPKVLGETTKKERPDVVAGVREMMLSNRPEGIANALGALAARADSTTTLGQIRVPTLVLCGEEDVLTPMAEAETIARAVAGGRLVAIPKAGHLSNIESPSAFNAAVASFLAGLA